MLTHRDILRRNGQPLSVELTQVAENRRLPAGLFGFVIELPDEVKEGIRAEYRRSGMRLAEEMGVDLDEAAEAIEEELGDRPIEALAAQPFELCWN